MGCPGAIVVWSGNGPMLATHRIPPDGLVLGRDHGDGSDDRISRQHVRFVHANDRIEITDLQSRNGTYVQGAPLVERSTSLTRLPAVIRTGRTVSVLVDDVRPYENVAIARRGSCVVAGTLAESCRILDQAAIDEENVTILGTFAVGVQLAHSYAAAIGGDSLIVDLDISPIPLHEKLPEAGSPRTMILLLRRPICLPDLPELAQWLETTVRIASVALGREVFEFVPKETRARLAPRVVDIPALRLDELPTTIQDLVAAKAPGTTIHPTLIESALLYASRGDEQMVLRSIADCIEIWRRSGDTTLRGEDLTDHVERENMMKNCHAGVIRRR